MQTTTISTGARVQVEAAAVARAAAGAAAELVAVAVAAAAAVVAGAETVVLVAMVRLEEVLDVPGTPKGVLLAEIAAFLRYPATRKQPSNGSCNAGNACCSAFAVSLSCSLSLSLSLAPSLSLSLCVLLPPIVAVLDAFFLSKKTFLNLLYQHYHQAVGTNRVAAS